MNHSFDVTTIPLLCDSSGVDSSDTPLTPFKSFASKSDASQNSASASFNESSTNAMLASANQVSDSTKQPKMEVDFAQDSFDMPAGEENQSQEAPQVSQAPAQSTPENENERAFLVLDEIANSEEEQEMESDFDESDIDEMLERGLGERAAKRQKMNGENEEEEGEVDGEQNEKDSEYISRMKTILIEKTQNHFEVLPDGWIMVTHSSGMPIYLHRTSRVCTITKPYFLGGGSCRHHRVPLSAVPCLEYRRAIEMENSEPTNLVVNGTTIPHARVVTAQENDQTQQLSPEELKEYCKKLFQFKEIEILRFSSWPARRKYHKKKRSEQRPSLPEGSKLIMCPIRKTGEKEAARGPTEWIMNPNGKTYVCILHDYVQRALKERPVYTFKELENTATPYLVTISINGVEYGKGLGSSKKLAKMEAAKATLDILIPGMKDKIEEDPRMTGRAGESKQNSDLSFFDDIKIEDPRVVEFCTKTTEPLPHAILLTCLQRNFGLSEMNISYNMRAVKHGKNEFTMTVGKHTATVECQNKRDGKQRASQALLQIFHPHIPCWGSLLRLYGNSSVKSFKEKKVEEQEITALQSKGDSHGPNLAILNKLKQEMHKLKQTRKGIQSIGIFVPPNDIKMPTSSMSDLNNIAL